MIGRTVLLLCVVVGFSIAVVGQQEVARVLRNGNEATLSVFSARPLDAAAAKLAEEFGVGVNVEDPIYFYRDDIEDVTAEVSRVANPRKRTLVPKGYLLETTLDLGPNGSPRGLSTLLQTLVDIANVQVPFGYRVDSDGDVLTLVATRTRDDQGRSVDVTPILDHRVDIPSGTRRVFEHVNLLTRELERQTGFHIGCCQAGVAGMPWGSTVVLFEAKNEVARNVLLRLVGSEPGRYHWLLRCQPGESECFINIAPVPAKN